MNKPIIYLNTYPYFKLPIIQLTRSRDGTTGTATFLFLNPGSSLYSLFSPSKEKILFPITSLSLFSGYGKIKTNLIQVEFYKGSPFLIKAIFLFRNQKEWFIFLQFLILYAKEKGLFFVKSK